MEEDFEDPTIQPIDEPQWERIGAPPLARMQAPPVPQPESDIEVSADRVDRRTPPQQNVPLAPSQESVARGQSAAIDPDLKFYQDELRFRLANNLPRRPAFQPEEMNPNSQYLERRFTPQQEQEFAAINRQMDIVSKDNTINEQMKAELLGKLEQRQNTIRPHLLPIKKSPYPEGQGVGDAWKNPDYPGAIFTRNKNGEQQIHWDPTRPEKLTDSAIVRMAIEQKKADADPEGGPSKRPITEYIREVKEGIEAIRQKKELPLDQQEAAAAKMLASVDPRDPAGLQAVASKITELYPKTPTANKLAEERGAAPRLEPPPPGAKYEQPRPWWNPRIIGTGRDPMELKDPVEKYANFVSDAKAAGDTKAEEAARQLADIARELMRTKKAPTPEQHAKMRQLDAEVLRFHRSRFVQ